MEERLLQYFELKKSGVSIQNVIKDFQLSSDNEVYVLITCLEKLEKLAKLYVDQKNNYMIFPKDNNLAQGKLIKDKKGNFYINNGLKINIDSNYLNGAIEGDIVLITTNNYNSSGESTGRVKKIVSRNDRNFVFECKRINSNNVLLPVMFELKEKVSFPQKDVDNLVEGTRVLVEISTEKINGEFKGKIINEIGHKDDPDIRVKEIAISNGINIDFSSDALKELDDIPNYVSEKEINNRLDLRDKTIFTIDSESTKDIDDAISLEINDRGNYVLGVHIADVSYYVRPGSKLFEEAVERANSVYALDYVIPMLPHQLSNGICSLNEKSDRLTKSCIMEIDKKGKVVDYKICDSVINSNKKMTYENVNKILSSDVIPEGYEKYSDKLKLMMELSLKLDEKRMKQGRIDFCNNELKVTQDNTGKVISVNQIKCGPGQKLIENFMVLANETVASNYSYLTFVYRVHDLPNEVLLKKIFEYIKSLNLKIKIPNNITNPRIIQNTLLKLKELPEYPLISDWVLRGMSKAFYDTNNIGHFALASSAYTHFTSPIRRINDLVVHSLINLYNSDFTKEKFDDLEKRLKEICLNASKKERIADTIEKEVTNLAILDFLRDNIGNKFDATIIYITSKFVTVKLDNGIMGNVNIKSFEKFGYSYRANSNTLKCNNDILSTGSNISINILESSSGNNKILFGFTKEKVKQLIK